MSWCTVWDMYNYNFGTWEVSMTGICIKKILPEEIQKLNTYNCTWRTIFFFRFKYWRNVTTLAIGIASTSLEYIWVSAICSQFGTELQLKQFHCEQYIINFRAYEIQDQKDILDVSSISTNWQLHTVVFFWL